MDPLRTSICCQSACEPPGFDNWVDFRSSGNRHDRPGARSTVKRGVPGRTARVASLGCISLPVLGGAGWQLWLPSRPIDLVVSPRWPWADRWSTRWLVVSGRPPLAASVSPVTETRTEDYPLSADPSWIRNDVPPQVAHSFDSVERAIASVASTRPIWTSPQSSRAITVRSMPSCCSNDTRGARAHSEDRIGYYCLRVPIECVVRSTSRLGDEGAPFLPVEPDLVDRQRSLLRRTTRNAAILPRGNVYGRVCGWLCRLGGHTPDGKRTAVSNPSATNARTAAQRNFPPRHSTRRPGERQLIRGL